MKRIKTFVLSLIILLPFAVGCASGGIKKPTVFSDKSNKIPADTPSQFDSRYERFISDKEMEAFHKLQTDEERQAFQDKFWAERDFDPSTSENEYKQEIDERIDDIANELFLSTPGVFGLSFRSNGGFRGDMAHVYLLHGEPEPNAMDTIEGQSFVDLMLWIYENKQSGEIMYFLFYQKGSMGAFTLFPQDIYKLDPCGAVNEIRKLKEFNNRGGSNQACPPDVENVFREIQTANGRGGTLDGYVFIWSLFNFSQNGSITQGRALGVPKPASEVAKQSKARVTGEAPKLVGTAGTDYILASCEKCNSMIPGELQLGKEFSLSIHLGDIDWRVTGNRAEVELKVRLVLENIITNMQLVFEPQVGIVARKDVVVTHASDPDVVTILTADEVNKIPTGTYRVSVYIKNITPGLMTNKYNAWDREFTK